MTKEEANQILAWLKEGKEYKTGHYHYAYNFYSYNKNRQAIQIFIRDHSMNVFEPHEETIYQPEDKYLEQLIAHQNFDDIKQRMSL